MLICSIKIFRVQSKTLTSTSTSTTTPQGGGGEGEGEGEGLRWVVSSFVVRAWVRVVSTNEVMEFRFESPVLRCPERRDMFSALKGAVVEKARQEAKWKYGGGFDSGIEWKTIDFEVHGRWV